MLKAELLKSNEALATLTEDQIKVIETLSINDENEVIGRKTGEIWGSIDNDIKETIGVEKPQGIKTFDWLKTDILPKVKASTTLESTIAGQKNKIAELEQAVADKSTDETLKKQLKDAQDALATTKATLEDEKKNWEKKLNDSVGELTSLKLNTAFDSGLRDVKFKDEKLVPKAIREMVIKTAKNEIMSKYDPEYVDVEGKSTLVFRDNTTKQIALNKANALNPFTASELILSQDIVKDVIDAGNVRGGTGSTKADPETPTAEFIDISGVKTQVEADRLIMKHLNLKGLSSDSPEFDAEFSKIRKEQEVMKLPIR